MESEDSRVVTPLNIQTLKNENQMMENKLDNFVMIMTY